MELNDVVLVSTDHGDVLYVNNDHYVSVDDLWWFTYHLCRVSPMHFVVRENVASDSAYVEEFGWPVTLAELVKYGES